MGNQVLVPGAHLLAWAWWTWMLWCSWGLATSLLAAVALGQWLPTPQLPRGQLWGGTLRPSPNPTPPPSKHAVSTCFPVQHPSV